MSKHALGILASVEALHAVLLERTEEGTVVRFQISIPRTTPSAGENRFAEPGRGNSGFEEQSSFEEESDDVTIQFGDEGGGDNMFLGSEFEDLDSEGGSPAPTGRNFQGPLEELLDKCVEHGYDDPEIAFCAPMSNVDDVELRLPADEGTKQSEESDGLPLPASRSVLLEMLEKQYEGGLDSERVGFVPMHETGDGRQRVLALIARPGGEVLSTLSKLRDQTLSRTPRSRLLDSEVPLYLGLARSVLQLPPDTPEKTILVRVGVDDTLVLFMEGNTLRQAEHLPELTVEDPAETICSRVLLLQDEYGMGEIQHLLLSAQKDEGVLEEAFKSYFSSASLRLLHEHLPKGGENSGLYVAATGVALRLLDDPEFAPSFQSINLLPKDYTKSRFRLPVGWSVPALLTVLGLMTLGFVWYYVSNASAISERRSQLRTLEQQIAQVDVPGLKRRTDSLQSAASQYEQGLSVIDRLLKGSNKWSKGLATVARQINSVGGVSLDEWRPQGDEVQLAGRSTDRQLVVSLLRQLGGDISSLVFTEIREETLYDFQVTVPLDSTRPEAVSYWRNQQMAAVEGADTVEADPIQTASMSGGTEPESSSSGSQPEATSSTGASSTSGETGDTASASTGSAETASARSETQEAVPQDASTASTGDDPGASSSDQIEAMDAQPWTLVVASLVDKPSAQEVARTFRGRFSDTEHSIRIRQSPENGRYRVGVGTFSSIEAAQSTMLEFGDAFPEDTWMHRISQATDESTSSSGGNADDSG